MRDKSADVSVNLSRRKFIKTACIGAGAAAIGTLSVKQAKAISPEQVPQWDYEADVLI